MLVPAQRPLVGTHWGTYRVDLSQGRPIALQPWEEDPDPSPLAQSMLASREANCRIRRPAVRASFLRNGVGAGGQGRGSEAFVEVPWDVALDLAASHIDRVRGAHGNEAIFGGSYGWASAGRFHHAQSQVHRFLNLCGGYTRSVQNYSFAAGDVLLPHVIGSTSGLSGQHTTWGAIAEHTQLMVLFGGAPLKNSQVSSGGIGRHVVREAMCAARDAGVKFVSLSPLRDDTLQALDARHLAIRPNTDVALMLSLAHVLIEESLVDTAFLDRCTVGYERFADHVMGRDDGQPKTPRWAEAITGVPAADIRQLATEMARSRTLISVSWSLQRAEHGEQPYWAAVNLAAMLGGIGRPGEGFGFGYASVNGIGNPATHMRWPSLPQGVNAVSRFIPVARLTDMLLAPGQPYAYNGQELTYPDIRLVYWAGGNPFHHQQDLNRLCQAWARPEVVIVNEVWWNALARRADIVFPVTSPLERNDLVCSARDRMLFANHRVFEPHGEARNDFDVFLGMAERLGLAESFSERLDEEGWLRRLYGEAQSAAEETGTRLPAFDEFWELGVASVAVDPARQPPPLARFRDDPQGRPLRTPSGRIEMASSTIEAFGYPDCPAHPTWIPPTEWSEPYPLHLVSNQPADKLHSQHDCGPVSAQSKADGRQIVRMHPADAQPRGVRSHDLVRVFNGRGACLAVAMVTDVPMPGVVQMPTGAWFDPVDPSQPGSLEKHGNPNVLTRDQGTSRLAQGSSAHTCRVDIELFQGTPPPITCFDPPRFVLS
jgi:biotin/methionine sulfoxide reductase